MISLCQAGIMGKLHLHCFHCSVRLLDQRWWAARVTELGCGSKPVKAALGKSLVENPLDSLGNPLVN